MPTKAGYACRYPGCAAIVRSGGYCGKHVRHARIGLAESRAESDRKYNAGRPASDSFYKTQAWREMARRVLKEQPICAICHAKPSSIADHIEAMKWRPDLAMVRSNLRGVCHSCHNRYGDRVLRPRLPDPAGRG